MDNDSRLQLLIFSFQVSYQVPAWRKMESLEEHFDKTDEIRLKSNYGEDYLELPRGSETVTVPLIDIGRTTRTIIIGVDPLCL